MNQAESDQMKEMFNWCQKNDSIMSMQIKTYKRYNAKDKYYMDIWEVSSMHWIGTSNLWKEVKGSGPSVLEAMSDYAGKTL